MDIQKEFESSLLKSISILSRTKKLSVVSGYILRYGSLAREDLLKQKNAKKNYFKASKAALLDLKLINNYYTQYTWTELPIPSFVATMYWGCIPFLLSDNTKDLLEFAQIIDRKKGDIFPIKKDIAVSYALKYLLLGDKIRAIDYIKDFYITCSAYNRGLAIVVAGILKQDINLINEGIEFEIKYHKRKYKKEHRTHFISEAATAWVKLARMHGFEPDTSSEFINKELLKNDNDIIYDDIIEIYEALEIEGYKKRSWLKDWF
jgi:hypothetical protein